jgi:hypothetical protein
MLKQIAVAALLVLACTNANAHTKIFTFKSVHPTMATLPGSSEEVRVLKALLEAEKRHNEDVL